MAVINISQLTNQYLEQNRIEHADRAAPASYGNPAGIVTRTTYKGVEMQTIGGGTITAQSIANTGLAVGQSLPIGTAIGSLGASVATSGRT